MILLSQEVSIGDWIKVQYTASDTESVFISLGTKKWFPAFHEDGHVMTRAKVEPGTYAVRLKANNKVFDVGHLTVL